MNGFINFFLHFVFIATFVFLIIVSFIILRPFRIHRTRMASTMALKLSYLLYLAVFISLIYLVLFFSEIPEEEAIADDLMMKLSYIIIVISFFIPNLAIMLRRKVKKLRQQYNVFFTAVNVFIVLALLFVIRYFPFQF